MDGAALRRSTLNKNIYPHVTHSLHLIFAINSFNRGDQITEEHGGVMRRPFGLIAILTLTGCRAVDLPICVTEDPAYIKYISSCTSGFSELRNLFRGSVDHEICNEQANAKGLYRRSPAVCLDPILHADIIRQKK